MYWLQSVCKFTSLCGIRCFSTCVSDYLSAHCGNKSVLSSGKLFRKSKTVFPVEISLRAKKLHKKNTNKIYSLEMRSFKMIFFCTRKLYEHKRRSGAAPVTHRGSHLIKFRCLTGTWTWGRGIISHLHFCMSTSGVFFCSSSGS